MINKIYKEASSCAIANNVYHNHHRAFQLGLSITRHNCHKLAVSLAMENHSSFHFLWDILGGLRCCLSSSHTMLLQVIFTPPGGRFEEGPLTTSRVASGKHFSGNLRSWPSHFKRLRLMEMSRLLILWGLHEFFAGTSCWIPSNSSALRRGAPGFTGIEKHICDQALYTLVFNERRMSFKQQNLSRFLQLWVALPMREFTFRAILPFSWIELSRFVKCATRLSWASLQERVEPSCLLQSSVFFTLVFRPQDSALLLRASRSLWTS